MEGIDQDGRMSLKMDGGRPEDRVVELYPATPSWGAKHLLNNRIAYVAVSRRAYDVQLFTDRREKLGSALGHDVSHTSAHTPDPKPPQRELAEAPKQEKSQDLDVGLSL